MLGFIKKDLFLIKNSAKTLVILIILFIIMAYFGEMNLFFIIPFTSIIMMMTTFNFDAYSKWDAFAAALPSGRENSVKAKYFLTLAILLLATLIASLLSFLFSASNHTTLNLDEFLMLSSSSFFGASLAISVFYPVIYKFGIEKAGIGIFALFLGSALALGFFANYLDFSPILNTLNSFSDYLTFILLIASVALLFISYQISTKIYQAKEF